MTAFSFEIGIDFLEAYLILDFLSKYFGYRVSKAKSYWGFISFWILSSLSIAFFSWNVAYENYSTAAQIILNFIFCFILLKGNISEKGFLSAFIMGCDILTGTITALLFSKAMDYHISGIIGDFGPIRVIAVLVSKLLLFQACRIILRIKENSHLETQDFFFLVIIPILSIGFITLMMYAILYTITVQLVVLLAVCVIFILNIFTYYMFVRLGRSNQLKLNYELLNVQYECEKENAKAIQKLYEKISAFRHDMKNHMLCISAMAEQGSNAELQEYIQKLLQHNMEMNRTFVFTGNDILDAILNTKLSDAQQKNIQFHTVITDTLNFFEPEDICILFGNLIDNALTAAEDTEEKMVNLQIQPQGDYVSIVISNSIKDSVLEANPHLKSTKENSGHGYGVKNIRKIVQKYYGIIQFFEKEKQFFCEILIPAVQNAQSRN